MLANGHNDRVLPRSQTPRLRRSSDRTHGDWDCMAVQMDQRVFLAILVKPRQHLLRGRRAAAARLASSPGLDRPRSHTEDDGVI